MRRLSIVLAALALSALAGPSASEPPKDWFLAGSSPQDYTVGVDLSAAHSGAKSAFLASNSDTPSGFGTLMQTAQADTFKGKRLRFRAHVRSEGVKEWAGLWVRVDGSSPSPLAFDNMHDRPVKGDSNWQAYSIVLDVPPEATAIAFGILLHGAGKVWLDSAAFEVVDKSVPTTGAPAPRVPPLPSNLDFEQ
ncbi:MAG: hypothetical protein OEN01_14515 [Candidatus Krumholzibacteria bacterium]|nr:hypothetical protein [Candidatus Krumholzibacteria bacterium]